MHDWAFVGRDGPLARIESLVADDRSVVVTGVAGSGKSRLLWELADRLDRSGGVPIRIVATATAASIPFAALAPILRVEASGVTPLDLLALARSGLRDRLSAGGGALLVDDVARLDAGSATFLHQVVIDRLCPVIATARLGESGSDAVRALVGEPHVGHIELEPLDHAEITRLVEQVLGGQCGAGVAHTLGSLSGGNPLQLRELVHHGIDAGWLASTGGLWRVVDEVGAPPSLTELVAAHVAGLSGAGRDAMEILASAERIDLDQISRLVALGDIEQLEAAGLARIESTGGRAIVVLAHPLYGEAVRASLPTLRRRRIATQLAEVVEQAGFPSAGAVMRVVQWRLDAGVDVDPGLITHAAREAWTASEFGQAEQLATMAIERGAGFEAGLIVAESAMLTGHHERAESVMSALFDQHLDHGERARLANARAYNLAEHLDRQEDAIEVLEQALAGLPDESHADLLRSRAVTIHALTPRPQRALDLAAPILERPSSADFHRVAYASSLALATMGRTAEALEMGAAGFRAHDAIRDSARQIPESQHIGPILALVAAGRLDEAAALTRAGRERSAASFDAESQATFALLDGLVTMSSGRLTDATRSFREAAAINTDIGDRVACRWSLGAVALSAAMAGDHAAATSAASHLDAVASTATKLLDAQLVERGRAWARLASGDEHGAASILRAAAGEAASTDQLVAEAVLRHDLASVERRTEDAERLDQLAGMIDSALIATMAAHARALVAHDASALEDVARAFSELGFPIDGAIAASQAAREHRSAGLDRRARAAESLGDAMLSGCQGARPPLMTVSQATVGLTRREREVAILAADGCANREIGERLYLSVRTVENHLQRAYEKLGIATRGDLPAALEIAGERPRPRSAG